MAPKTTQTHREESTRAICDMPRIAMSWARLCSVTVVLWWVSGGGGAMATMGFARNLGQNAALLGRVEGILHKLAHGGVE